MRRLEIERRGLPCGATHNASINTRRWEADGCLGQRLTARVWIGTPGVEVLVIIDTGMVKCRACGYVSWCYICLCRVVLRCWAVGARIWIGG